MPHLTMTSATELSVELEDGRRFALHPIWLRERCQDPQSLDLRTGQRLTDPSDIDLTLAVTAVTPSRAGHYRVRFSDGHESEFRAQDLLSEASLAPGAEETPALRLWDATLAPLPRLAWSDAPSPTQLGEWLQAFLELGFVILTGVPAEPRSVLRVAGTFGFTRETNFGALFDVRSTAAASDLAYTSLPLDPHTDNPYRTPVPGVQLLHCLVNETSGGLSTLVDGFAAATALKARDPAAFALLATTPVRFRYRDDRTDLLASAPPIELDVTGALRCVHFSPRLDFVPLQPPAALARYYRARRSFDHLLRSADYELRFRLDEGELLMMDNRRLLHGRTGFDPREGSRHLQGCYIDIDGPRSLYRVLRRSGGAREESA